MHCHCLQGLRGVNKEARTRLEWQSTRLEWQSTRLEWHRWANQSQTHRSLTDSDLSISCSWNSSYLLRRRAQHISLERA
jgi:hypothetical protein